MSIYTCAMTPHGQRNLAGYSPWGHNESDFIHTCVVKPQGQRNLEDYGVTTSQTQLSN